MELRVSTFARAFSACCCVLVLAGCCDSCRCLGRSAESLASTPSEETVQRSVSEKIASDLEILEQLCGIPTKELQSVVVQVKTNVLGTGDAQVSGTASVAEPDGGVRVSRVLVCAGIVEYALSPKLDPEGKIKGYKVELYLKEVTTAGVSFTAKPRPTHHHHH